MEEPVLISICQQIRTSLKERSSNFNSKKVAYFKGKTLFNVLCKNKIKTQHPLKTKKDMINFIQHLIQKKMISKVQGQFRGSGKDPFILKPSQQRNYQPDGFYIWNPKIHQVKWQKSFLFLLVLVVIGICCFPVWPIWAKLGAWYCSVFLLCLILSVTFIRYILFLLLYIVGVQFWLLPNMYDDRAGFWETLTPFYFYRKRDDGIYTIIMRVVITLFVSALSLYLYLNPEILDDLSEVSVGGVSQLINWGEQKIYANTTQIAGFEDLKYSYDEILKESLKLDQEESL